jgi:hypothetical protein
VLETIGSHHASDSGCGEVHFLDFVLEISRLAKRVAGFLFRGHGALNSPVTLKPTRSAIVGAVLLVFVADCLNRNDVDSTDRWRRFRAPEKVSMRKVKEVLRLRFGQFAVIASFGSTLTPWSCRRKARQLGTRAPEGGGSLHNALLVV